MDGAGAALAYSIYMLIGWFGVVAHESEGGQYNKQVDLSFRWGMSWFIFSEVMFFAAFFGTLFYLRVLSVPWLGQRRYAGTVVAEFFRGAWPVFGTLSDGKIYADGRLGHPGDQYGDPAFFRRHGDLGALGADEEQPLAAHWGLVATIALGILFLSLQAYEYIHAYHELNLTLGMGAYGATFFMLTGFHGFHVTVGTIMLMVILFRSIKGHFSADHHFGFEGVAWYWHFVDVVWLLLFVLVYWL